VERRVAYHDACHLAHAQGIREQPRRLLQQIPGLQLIPFAEPDLCCGSAGIYNLVQPEPARELGRRKLANVVAASPEIIATANPGCTLQLTAIAEEQGQVVRVLHPIELLDASIRGERV
jgi:glycolate oxidase iron-sulfur subunit